MAHQVAHVGGARGYLGTGWGVAAVIAGLAVAQAGPGLTALRPVRTAAFPRLAGHGQPRHVALTFDDGPDPAWTPQFLDLLAARSVRATFFLLGSMVARNASLAARIAAAGHEVGVHGYEHRYLVARSPRAVAADLRLATEVIGSATGTAPRLFRPPYGVLSGPGLAACRRLGLAPVLWTSWGREWVPGSTPQSVFGTLTTTLRGGATVLLHDSEASSPPGSAQAALGATALLLSECSRRGLAVGPLADHGITSGGRAHPRAQRAGA